MQATAPRREIPSLTAIRGVAALAVVVHHQVLFFRFNEWTHPFTLISTLFMLYTGVDVFFVLSGFILTRLYLNLRLKGWGMFFWRRILRIYPLHLSILGFMAVCSLCSVFWLPTMIDWHSLAWSATLLGPFVGIDAGLWNSVSWSISVELICYLGFPIGVFLLRRAPLGLLLLAFCLMAYLTWRVHLVHAESWDGANALYRGGSDFALGMLGGAFSIHQTLSKNWTQGLEALGAGLIIWGLASMQPAFVPLGAVVLILALSSQKGVINAILSPKPLVYLGEISFSIYLLQTIVFYIFSIYWPIEHYPAIINPPWAAPFILHELGYFALLLAISSLTYHFIEKPCRALGHRQRAKGPANG